MNEKEDSFDELSETERQNLAMRLLSLGVVGDEPVEPSDLKEGDKKSMLEAEADCIAPERWDQFSKGVALTPTESRHFEGCEYCKMFSHLVLVDLPAQSLDLLPEGKKCLPFPIARTFSLVGNLAAASADGIVSSSETDWGTVRLLRSPMRKELAVEIVSDSPEASLVDTNVFILLFEGQPRPVAVFANESPVFTNLYERNLVKTEPAYSVTVKSIDDLTEEDVGTLKISKQKLVHIKSRPLYDRFIAGADL